MSFYERYELLELDRDDGVKTFQAREIATGRPVKVHLFVAPSSPYQAQLWRKIDQLPESERARVLDRGKHEGTRYLVTDRLVDYPGLFEWISASLKKAGGKTPLGTAGAWKVPAPAATPASYEAPSDPPRAQSIAPPENSVLPAPSSPSREDLNREFSDLFKTTERPVFSLPPEPARSIPARSGPEVSAPPGAGHNTAPGEFTMFVEAPSPAEPAPQSPPVRKSPNPKAPGGAGPDRAG